MRNFKILLAGLLALVMALGLLACGEEEPVTPPQDGQVIESTVSSAGSIVLCGTTRYTLHYNGKGNITAITDQDDVACYSQLFGTSCASAVSQILSNPEEPFSASYLLIKQNVNSLDPSNKFLDEIVTEAKKALETVPVLLCVAADQDQQGYFSAKTAERVLAAYLGSANIECEIVAGPVDGYYHARVTDSNRTMNLTVGALYGSVQEQLEYHEEEPYTEEELNPDYALIDPGWEYIDDSMHDDSTLPS